MGAATPHHTVLGLLPTSRGMRRVPSIRIVTKGFGAWRCLASHPSFLHTHSVNKPSVRLFLGQRWVSHRPFPLELSAGGCGCRRWASNCNDCGRRRLSQAQCRLPEEGHPGQLQTHV